MRRIHVTVGDVSIIRCDVIIISCDVIIIRCDVIIISCDVIIIRCDVIIIRCDVIIISSVLLYSAVFRSSSFTLASFSPFLVFLIVPDPS